MIKKSCPYCESVQDVKEIKQKETIEYKGKIVSYDAIHYECCHCHDIFDLFCSYISKKIRGFSANFISNLLVEFGIDFSCS